MKLSHKDLLHVAELARLRIPDALRDTIERQFNEIVGYVEKLKELDTEGIEPTAQVIGETGRKGTPLAADKVEASLPKEDVLRNAPDKQDDFFKVPRMIGDEEAS